MNNSRFNPNFSIKYPNIIVKYEVARFARTLGTLIHHGVSMLKAVDISVSTVGNTVLKISLLELTPMIKRGSK